MPRIPHGAVVTLEQVNTAVGVATVFAERHAGLQTLRLPFSQTLK